MWAFSYHIADCLETREKLIKMDEKRREYDIVVIGEEPHLAYNRVGLTSFFQHRKAENLYLNPHDWVGQSTLHNLELGK